MRGATPDGIQQCTTAKHHSYNQLEFGIRVEGGLMASTATGVTTNMRTYTHSNFVVRNCTVHDISGNPGTKGQGTVTSSTTGHGIRIMGVDGASVTDSIAYNIGWTNGFHGNGAGGIWGLIVNKLIISHSVAHHIYNGYVGIDGNGFGLDGGSRNSVIEFCLSYLNDGVGHYIDEYGLAPDAANNTIRYCVSYHDGQFAETGGIVLWEDPQKQGSETGNNVYGNTIITAKPEPNRWYKGHVCHAWGECLVDGKPNGLEYPWYNTPTSFRNTSVLYNVFIALDDTPALSLSTAYPKTLNFDFNSYYSPGSTTFEFQWGRNQTTLHKGWNEFKKLTGFEMHGHWQESPQNMTMNSDFFQDCVKWESYFPSLPDAPSFKQARAGFAGCNQGNE
eukprot:TRINITY_DN47771_c0_g1_i1.p1 TRINITY_DN47771_c0_g1~~TRINITY_DN47771_c0_g1_i1.p1  ORF type:complete len:390 (+),score=31.74 TRINITY_DN47771_c0_g1_i1:260-1429(+)